MIRAVIDTNVLVSAFWTRNRLSPTVRIVQAMVNGGFTPVYSPEMISEYREVLSRAKFDFSADEVNALVNHIVASGELAEPADVDAQFPDPKDKVFYCTAFAGDTHLVTGNMKHYPRADFVVTPAQFCDLAGI